MKNKLEKYLRKLFKAIDEEPGVCGEEDAGFMCTRSKDHRGVHVATGLSEIKHIWPGGYFIEDNPEVDRRAQKIVKYIRALPGYGTCGAYFTEKDGAHWKCNLPKGHSGRHIATGCYIDAMWS